MHVKRIETLDFALENQPTALSQIFNAFYEMGVNVTWFGTYEANAGELRAQFYASNMQTAKDVLVRIGKHPVTAYACYAEGEDKLGNYAEIVAKLSRFGVSITASYATAIDGKMAAVFISKEHESLCRCLGC